MKLAPSRRAVRFSPDEWMERLGIDIWDSTARERIESIQWDLTQELLATGKANVIIEWGTWARSERDVLREQARQLGAAVELHYLEALGLGTLDAPPGQSNRRP
jgi:predicted kinase